MEGESPARAGPRILQTNLRVQLSSFRSPRSKLRKEEILRQEVLFTLCKKIWQFFFFPLV